VLENCLTPPTLSETRRGNTANLRGNSSRETLRCRADNPPTICDKGSEHREDNCEKVCNCDQSRRLLETYYKG
jgi:hypothetical protein